MRLDRIEKEEEILVEVIECPDRPELNNTSFACRTLDVSEEGLKVISEMDLPINTIVGLRMEVAGNLYRLRAHVSWSNDDRGFNVGLLLDTESPDYAAWIKMFEIDYDSNTHV